jgi:hypothetical protein
LVNNLKEKKEPQIKCRYCGTKVNKIKAFPHPTKPRYYYCNEECYNNEVQKNQGRKINSTVADGMVTCRCCGKKIIKEQAFSIKERYYYCSEQEYESKYKGSEAYWEETFLDYVYFDITVKQCDYPSIQRQAGMYHDKYNFKWTGMVLTLQYWFETLQNSWNSDYGLGQIFPKYYEEAKNFYYEKQEIQKKVNEMEEGDKIIKIPRKNKSVKEEIKKWEDL